jgi:transposase InsO family protein
VGKKKQVYVMTLEDRTTRCILGWAVSSERNKAVLQQVVDAAPQAAFWFSDLYAPYRNLVYTHGLHPSMPDKSETYRVKGLNAKLRHYRAA